MHIVKFNKFMLLTSARKLGGLVALDTENPPEATKFCFWWISESTINMDYLTLCRLVSTKFELAVK